MVGATLGKGGGGQGEPKILKKRKALIGIMT